MIEPMNAMRQTHLLKSSLWKVVCKLKSAAHK